MSNALARSRNTHETDLNIELKKKLIVKMEWKLRICECFDTIQRNNIKCLISFDHVYKNVCLHSYIDIQRMIKMAKNIIKKNNKN